MEIKRLVLIILMRMVVLLHLQQVIPQPLINPYQVLFLLQPILVITQHLFIQLRLTNQIIYGQSLE